MRKIILWTLVPALLFFLLFLILGGFKIAVPLILAAMVLWIIGLVFGVLLAAIIKSPKKEPWIYLSAQIGIYCTAVTIFFVNNYKETQREKATENIRHNHHMVELDTSNPYPVFTRDQEYIKTAFKKLESTFSDPNSFRLRSFFTKTRDTALSTYTETVYTLYFAYSTKENDHLFSRISVLEYKAYIDILNGDSETNKEYKTLRAKQEQETQKDLKPAMDVLRELPDSTKKQIRESIDPD